MALFLKIPGEHGSSTDPDHPNEFVLESISMGMHRRPGGVASPIEVNMSTNDLKTATLMKFVADGRNIPEATVTGRSKEPDKRPVWRFVIKNAFITSFQMNGKDISFTLTADAIVSDLPHLSGADPTATGLMHLNAGVTGASLAATARAVNSMGGPGSKLARGRGR